MMWPEGFSRSEQKAEIFPYSIYLLHLFALYI